MLFVPNIAESVSKGLAGAVYGVILLLVIYLMPAGAAGLVRLITAQIRRDRAARDGLTPGRKPCGMQSVR